MVNYAEAIKRPFTDLKKFLIGVVLGIIPIVNFFVGGYEIECIRTVIKKGKKDYRLPEWTNWGNLFFRGFLSFVIGLIWIIPLIVILLIALGSAFVSLFSLESAGVPAYNAIAGMGAWLIVLIIVALLIAYISPMSMVFFAKDYKFGDAFKLGKILKKTFTGTYFMAWIISIVISMVIMFVLSIIPFLGTMLSSFIVGVMMYTILGEVYSETE
ncbi:MAG: DUF4013 domain-containing protein [Candidatus Nanoarchaeia archaeon]|nr:DUF4013 domain-containing protein [Candidatus Nanoarchaeia archaeon]